MPWIWSDELAATAEAAGFDRPEIATWRRQPIAFAVEPDEAAAEIVAALLGAPPGAPPMPRTADSTPASEPTVDACTCGKATSTNGVDTL